MNNYLFAFTGEFGYELISWMPYLKHLKENGIFLRTLSRPDTKVLYNFSDLHIEKDISITDCWGLQISYQRIQEEYDNYEVIYPDFTKGVCIEGMIWDNRDIHVKIDETHYSKLDYSDITFDKSGWVVVNNKYQRQWGEETPSNTFSADMLQEIRDTIIKQGSTPFYNHFIETKEDKELKCSNIFGDNLDGANNKEQISMYNGAEYVVCVQGGNAYLPAICGKDLIMYMKRGNKTDYDELARLYNINIWVADNIQDIIRLIAAHKDLTHKRGLCLSLQDIIEPEEKSTKKTINYGSSNGGTSKGSKKGKRSKT